MNPCNMKAEPYQLGFQNIYQLQADLSLKAKIRRPHVPLL